MKILILANRICEISPTCTAAFTLTQGSFATIFFESIHSPPITTNCRATSLTFTIGYSQIWRINTRAFIIPSWTIDNSFPNSIVRLSFSEIEIVTTSLTANPHKTSVTWSWECRNGWSLELLKSLSSAWERDCNPASFPCSWGRGSTWFLDTNLSKNTLPSIRICIFTSFIGPKRKKQPRNKS